MATTRFAENYPVYANISLVAASGTNAVSASPSVDTIHRWDTLLASSTAAAPHDLRLAVTIGTVTSYLGSVSIPAGAGFTTVPAVDILAHILPNPTDGLVMPGLGALKGQLAVTLGAGETITVACAGGTL